MITVYKWSVFSATGCFVATGTIAGTLEDAKNAAWRHVYPDGAPAGEKQRLYRFDYKLIKSNERPRNNTAGQPRR